MQVLGRGEKEEWAEIEYSLHPSEHDSLPARREQCYPVHPPSPTQHTPDLRPTAILEGLPHHTQEANNIRRFAYTACPLEELNSPETSEQALPSHRKSASTVGWSCQFGLPWGSAPLSPSGPAIHSHPREMLYSHRAPTQHSLFPGRAL